MNIVEAINISRNSPSIIAKEMKSFIFGFKGRRKLSYFDLFLFYPLYSYKPSYEFFDKRMLLSNENKINFFITNSNLNPEIFANFKVDFYATIKIIKESIIYGINKNYFTINDDFNVELTLKSVTDKSRVSENIAKFLSTQSTAYLYNYFKVDIDAI